MAKRQHPVDSNSQKKSLKTKTNESETILIQNFQAKQTNLTTIQKSKQPPLLVCSPCSEGKNRRTGL